jgi:hypothetical protein
VSQGGLFPGRPGSEKRERVGRHHEVSGSRAPRGHDLAGIDGAGVGREGVYAGFAGEDTSWRGD